jgi:hypothetical protein
LGESTATVSSHTSPEEARPGIKIIGWPEPVIFTSKDWVKAIWAKPKLRRKRRMVFFMVFFFFRLGCLENLTDSMKKILLSFPSSFL